MTNDESNKHFSDVFKQFFSDHISLHLSDTNRRRSKEIRCPFKEQYLGNFIGTRFLNGEFLMASSNYSIKREVALSGDPTKSLVDYCLYEDAALVATCEFKGPYFRKPIFSKSAEIFTNGIPDLAADVHKQKIRAELFPKVSHFCVLVLNCILDSEEASIFCGRVKWVESLVPGALIHIIEQADIRSNDDYLLSLLTIEVGCDYDLWFDRHLKNKLRHPTSSFDTQ